MTLLAVRFIDIAMAFSMGGLWLFGAGFIYVLYRWILRFEAQEHATDDDRPSRAPTPTRTRPSASAFKPHAQPAAAGSFTADAVSSAGVVR